MTSLQSGHCEVLISCSGTFIDCLQPTQKLLDFLHEKEVLNGELVQKVLCRPNRGDRVRTLLDFLSELGPKSVSVFVDSLRETDQWYLANILAACLNQSESVTQEPVGQECSVPA